MSVADASNAVAGGINGFINWIFFWQSWDSFSKWMLIGSVCFVILLYLYFKFEYEGATRRMARRR